jgi:hypothetical protein
VSRRCSCFCSVMLTLSSTQPYPAKQNENDVPGCETPGPSSPVARSTRLDTSEESPTKETTSMRKGLMGSLRKQNLRSISSLRSLRSPTKTRQSDKHECFLVDVGVLTHIKEVTTKLVSPRAPKPRSIASTHRCYSTLRSLPQTDRYSILIAGISRAPV